MTSKSKRFAQLVAGGATKVGAYDQSYGNRGGSRKTSLDFQCAVKGAGQQRGQTRPGTGSLHPVAIGAVVEVTKLLKPLV